MAAATSSARVSAPAASSSRLRSSPTPGSARSSTTAACEPATSDSQVVPTQALPGSPAHRRGRGRGRHPHERRGRGQARRPHAVACPSDLGRLPNATPNQVFVENLYEVLLNHRADSGGLSAGTNFLNHGARLRASSRSRGSTEYLNQEANASSSGSTSIGPRRPPRSTTSPTTSGRATRPSRPPPSSSTLPNSPPTTGVRTASSRPCTRPSSTARPSRMRSPAGTRPSGPARRGPRWPASSCPFRTTSPM